MPRVDLSWSKLLPLTKTELTKLGNIAGVYRLSKKADDGNYYVFFVGSTENIKDKLNLHMSEEETNTKLRDFLASGGDFSFRYAIVTDKGQQEAIERQMYKHYLPEFNPSEPNSSLDIEANLN